MKETIGTEPEGFISSQLKDPRVPEGPAHYPTIRNVSADEAAKYAPPHVRDRISGGENLKRIAEFITRLTWRETVTMAAGIEAIQGDSLSASMVAWAEGVMQADVEHSKTL